MQLVLLNEQGHRPPRQVDGGGRGVRIGFFPVGNLNALLKNKMYLGIKEYREGGQLKSTEAV